MYADICKVSYFASVREEKLTLIYVDVPTNVSAMELISSPETPKSQIFISPLELHSIFDGLMSTKGNVIRIAY